jgi:xanthine dehydrogenase accessory factor
VTRGADERRPAPGGGELEARVRREAQLALADGRPRLARSALAETGADANGMLCGGDVTVFVEPYLPRPGLLIIGGRPRRTRRPSVRRRPP